jgi:sulfate adenylyltransferase
MPGAGVKFQVKYPIRMPSSSTVELKRQCVDAPSWELTAEQLAATEVLLSGALDPLDGFMNRAQAVQVLEAKTLPSGEFWPSLVVLQVSPDFAKKVSVGHLVALREPEGGIVAALEIEDIWSDARVSGGQVCLGGVVHALERARYYAFQPFWITPSQARRNAQISGWRHTIAVFVNDYWDDAAWESMVDLATRQQSGVMVFLSNSKVGLMGQNDVLLQRHWVKRIKTLHSQGKLICIPGIGDDYTHPLSLASVIAKNYGAHTFVTPDHLALVDDSFMPVTARDYAFLGIDYLPIAVEHTSAVAEPAMQGSANMPVQRLKGYTIFMTGLSGAGKSTIANALQARLWQVAERPVTLLDGDLVRKHLSSELGFSREHRDLNVTRIGYVASEITKHGGIAICAPIAPYRDARRVVRAMVAEFGSFIEIYVSTPLAVCEARDPKGLYAKARSGAIPVFTGVSDPYEIPEHPEMVVDTTLLSPELAVEQIVAELVRRGLL